VPNAARNYAVSGEAILISSHGGLNFFIGNNAEADGIYDRVPGITPSIAGQVRDATRVAETAEGRHLSASEVSAYFFQRAWAWIAANPGAALALFARKIALVLNKTNVPLNYSYAFYSRDETTLLRVLLVGPWMLMPLGLLGLLLVSVRREQPGFWVWASFIPIYGLSVAAFFVSDRYRMPLLVPLCATSAAALVWTLDRIREHKPRLTYAARRAMMLHVRECIQHAPKARHLRAHGLAFARAIITQADRRHPSIDARQKSKPIGAPNQRLLGGIWRLRQIARRR